MIGSRWQDADINIYRNIPAMKHVSAGGGKYVHSLGNKNKTEMHLIL